MTRASLKSILPDNLFRRMKFRGSFRRPGFNQRCIRVPVNFYLPGLDEFTVIAQ